VINANIPVYPTSRNAIEALKLEAYDFIGKAILQDELINAVEKHALGYAKLLGLKEAWDEATRGIYFGCSGRGLPDSMPVEEFLDFGKLDELGAGDYKTEAKLCPF